MTTPSPSTQSTPKDVEQNVIPIISSPPSNNNEELNSQSTNQSPSNTSSSPRSPPPGTINMTGLRTALPDIELNSPSTNIIGTPFAHTATNTPFEYPFPDTASDPASPPPSHPSHRPGSPQASFYPPYTGFHHPPTAPIAPPNLTTTFSLIHPELKSPSPTSPPMPPSLKKKRWSLNLLGRRRSSNPPTPGEGPTSPPGCPPAVTSGAILGGLGSGRPRLGDRASSGGIRPTEDSRKSIDT